MKSKRWTGVLLVLAVLFFNYAPVIRGESEEGRYEWHTIKWAININRLANEIWED